MFGSSRVSLAALQQAVDARSAAAAAAVSADLFAVADLLATNQSLRSTLADSGIAESGRRGVVADLFGGSLSADGLALAQDVAAARWSHDGDMVEALETLAAQVALAGASDAGELDRVEDEIFRFGRALDSSPELQLTLTDPSLPAQGKAAVVTELVGSQATGVTTALLAYTAGHLRGRAPAAAVSALSDLAAAQRNRVLAQVRTAVALSAEQQTRLSDALERVTGRKVKLDIEVTPDVVGGIVVRIGDEVIDGSISTRLEQARRALSA